MIQVKVLVVKGTIINRDKVRVNTLSEEIEKAINGAIKDFDGEVIDVQTETDFGSLSTGGSALILIKYQAAAKSKK